ncbi:glycosyltransferase [Propionibacteriaceae bacterium G1746]|uniref:glycosyltransferase n=1 Tax=Aestuariimicrobium sp. G57 TaxID=3418485 RepID=UPI003C290449
MPETSGGATWVENMSVALVSRGIAVEHISLVPGTRQPGFSTFVANPREQLHSGPALRSRADEGSRRWWRVPAAVPVVMFKRGDRWWLRRRLRRQLDGYGGDTVLVFTHVKPKKVVDECGWRPGADGPILVGMHHSQFEAIDIEAWLRPAIVRHYADLDGFVALTVEDADKFAPLLPQVRCVGIGNPYGPTHVAPRRQSVRRSRTAVALARLSGEKQLDVMVRCFVQAVRSAPELSGWQLHIHGEGPEREVLEHMVADLAAGTIVRLPGRSDDVDAVLADAGLHLLSSAYEGFGMSILEAARAGVPTVAFDVSPGVRTLVGAGGWLVPPGDKDAYTSALVQAMRSDEDRGPRGDEAQVQADRFSPESILAEWAQFLALLSAV